MSYRLLDETQMEQSLCIASTFPGQSKTKATIGMKFISDKNILKRQVNLTLVMENCVTWP
jgi:hypothetical protein